MNKDNYYIGFCNAKGEIFGYYALDRGSLLGLHDSIDDAVYTTCDIVSAAKMTKDEAMNLIFSMFSNRSNDGFYAHSCIIGKLHLTTEVQVTRESYKKQKLQLKIESHEESIIALQTELEGLKKKLKNIKDE